MQLELTKEQKELFGALVGLVRTMDQTGVDKEGTTLVVKALAAFDAPGLSALIGEIREKKRALAPDCAVCAHPCGHNDDYDCALLDREPPGVKERKLSLISRAVQEAKAFTPESNVQRILQSVFLVGEYLSPHDMEDLLT